MRGASRLVAAIAFLTRIPVGGIYDVAGGAAVFPLVGAALGAAVGGTAYGLARIVPALAAAGIALALGALLTGGLHLDGLADSADALAARSRAADARCSRYSPPARSRGRFPSCSGLHCRACSPKAPGLPFASARPRQPL